MANKSNFGLKLVVILAVLAAAAIAGVYLMRPVAKVVVVTKGQALNIVSGSVVIQAEGGLRSLTGDVGGRILWCDPLDPGKPIKEGEELVRLDTGDIDLDIDNTQINLDAAKKRVAAGSSTKFEYDATVEARVNLQRKFDRGLASELELTQAKRAEYATKLKLDLEDVANQLLIDGYDIALKGKKSQRAKMTIKAPFDGKVSAVFARKGDLIGAGSPIATIIATARTVEASISEENFGGIKLGQEALVTFLGGIGGRDPAYLYHATVGKILPTADPVTQRYLVHLDMKDVAPEELIPGKTGEVTITVGEHVAKAIVPRRALNGKTLYVVKDGRVERRTVEPGYRWLDGEEVKSGVEAGEEIIVDDLDSFRDGQSVRTEQVKLAATNSQ